MSRSSSNRTHVSLDPPKPTSVAVACLLRRARPRPTSRRKSSEPNQLKTTRELHRDSPEISTRINATHIHFITASKRRRASIVDARAHPDPKPKPTTSLPR
ncbi:hypothetical protein Bca4012_036395 [Brassica carinata]|uniref:Uncharacterized protein n=1 Tax=Brassica carinata TaxID=52824 RepID=A0A8X7WDX8_BRACI|nr:hypothetical protein Bca52824_010123 [Brassica carinata]